MFNLRKNNQENTLIIPVENYFIERAKRSGDEKLKNWTIVVCAAANQFFQSLFFEVRDNNNLFHTQTGRLEQVTIQKLFKVLAVFYLYLYCRERECDNSFVSSVNSAFEIEESDALSFSHYKTMEERRSELDYSALPYNLKDYLRSSKVPITAMMHFYGLLLEKGFNEDIRNRPGDLKLLVKIAEVAILHFDTLVIKNT